LKKDASPNIVILLKPLYYDSEKQKWAFVYKQFNVYNVDQTTGLEHLIPKQFKLDSRLESVYQGEAWGKKVVNIYNSAKIVINFVPRHMKFGGNLRTFTIPGSGAFQLTNRCPQDWFKPNQEIVIFS